MKERPILFSGPMVRALLAGTKTQTRRVLKQATGPSLSVGMTDDESAAELSWLWGDGPGHDVHETVKLVPCPYGQPGDRLWVRENGWERPYRSARDMREGADTWPPYEYDAEPVCCWEDGELKRLGWKRRPSIHMPRWASRILLEITAVRVERLQDISEADAMAEGIMTIYPDGIRNDGLPNHYTADVGHGHLNGPTAATVYRMLWEWINGPDSWDANPWVWVVEFKRVTP